MVGVGNAGEIWEDGFMVASRSDAAVGVSEKQEVAEIGIRFSKRDF